MGNKKRVGTKRSCNKKRKNVGKPANTVMLETTPVVVQPTTVTKCSRSMEKLGSNFEFYDKKQDGLENDIIDFNQLSEVISNIAVCRFCHHNLVFSKQHLSGLANKFRIHCPSCENSDESFVNCQQLAVSSNGDNDKKRNLL